MVWLHCVAAGTSPLATVLWDSSVMKITEWRTKVEMLNPKAMPSFPVQNRWITSISLHIHKLETFLSHRVCFSRGSLIIPGMSWFLHFTWQVVWGGDGIIFLTSCCWQRRDVLWSSFCPAPQTHRAGVRVFGDTSNIWRGDEHRHMSSATAAPWYCGHRNICLLFHEELPQTIRF